MAEVYRVIVVGEEGAGRTSLLEYVFMQPDSGRKRGMNRKTHGVEEIRFGAAEAKMRVNDYLTRRLDRKSVV